MLVERLSTSVIARCKVLQDYWQPRNAKMKVWYKLIQMVDELKTEKMESFVGNDPRSMYNLVLHMLDAEIPFRIKNTYNADMKTSAALAEVSHFFDIAWQDVSEKFRRSGPRQSFKRSLIGLLIATGWYSVFSIVTDSGDSVYAEIWHPAQVYPMWDADLGLSEVAHVFQCSETKAKAMIKKNNWSDIGMIKGDQTVYDLWWAEVADTFPYSLQVWNAIVVGGTLVKYEPTRFKRIPIYTAPVGGLPDTGPLSEGTELSSSYNAGGTGAGDRWKEEIGQSIVATNEFIYRSWNKWWTFSLQLLRDTAQPRIFERSRSGKAIVKPEDVFRRGAIFRGGPDDSVDFLSTPVMPLELRSTQLDLEAMMQRGGVSWALYGNMSGEVTAYVMSQIAASANQVMRPYHQAIQYLHSDIANDWLEDIRERGVAPYGWELPKGIPDNAKVSADYEIEIPGELIQKVTVARMLDPQFSMSYSYTVEKLFPDVKDPMRERARRLQDQAELSRENALIAQIRYYRLQSSYLQNTDADAARLYDLAADAAEMQLKPQQQGTETSPRPEVGNRTEALPQYNIPQG